MNAQRVWTVAHKDLIEVLRNRQALFPLIVIPLGLAVVIPASLMDFITSPDTSDFAGALMAFMTQMPAGVAPTHLNPDQLLVYSFAVFFMAPLFLLIPSMSATVIGSSSFVGEKERRTIEGLLYTPITNRELVLGKILASLIPSIVVTWTAFVCYALLVNHYANPVVGEVFFPTASWVVLMLVMVPLIAFLTVALIVAVSGRATSSQAAQGTSFIVVMPVILLTVGQSAGLLLFDTKVTWVASGIMVFINVLVFLAVARIFNRERILTKLR
ncbi:MAG: ABC transporter permease subunit [Actinomycetales bacterium]|nr:ABC transporter permease subunit [Actinomycetales bacterium]